MIGLNRATKIWGWLSKAVQEKKATLRLTTEWTNDWMNDQEHEINVLRADAVWAVTDLQKETITKQANRKEAVGAIRTWMKLNEEPEKEGIRTLRIGTLRIGTLRIRTLRIGSTERRRMI